MQRASGGAGARRALHRRRYLGTTLPGLCLGSELKMLQLSVSLNVSPPSSPLYTSCTQPDAGKGTCMLLQVGSTTQQLVTYICSDCMCGPPMHVRVGTGHGAVSSHY